MSKRKNKGRINPGERDEEATRAFDKRQQKEAAKIEMVYKLGQRKKVGNIQDQLLEHLKPQTLNLL